MVALYCPSLFANLSPIVRSTRSLANWPPLLRHDRLETMTTTSMLWLLGLVAGALIPVQAAANAALSKSIDGNVPFAALTLFVVAGISTAVAMLLTGGQIPTTSALNAAPW